MTAAERRMNIFKILNERSNVEVSELAEMFKVSGMTIRRDLSSFEKQGLVVTTYGGAYLNKDANIEPSFFIKSNQMMDKKNAIARTAAKYIHEGDSIIIDCGTTALQIAKYLPNLRITVITNSWPVINYLGSNSKVKLILLPGVYNDISAGAFGEMTINFVRNLNVDKVFIGTHGWDIEHGATVPEVADAEVKKALHLSAKQSFLLVDSSKFGEVYFSKHASLEDFNYIITNNGLNEDINVEMGRLCKNYIVTGE